MANNTTREIGVAVVLIGLFLALLNPFHLWMPTMLHMIMLALGIGAFGAYAIFVMREKAADERDGVHRMHSGRIAFLVGAGHGPRTIVPAGRVRVRVDLPRRACAEGAQALYSGFVDHGMDLQIACEPPDPLHQRARTEVVDERPIRRVLGQA